MQWTTCSTVPLAWIPLRELLLGLVHTPALLLPLAAVLGRHRGARPFCSPWP